MPMTCAFLTDLKSIDFIEVTPFANVTDFS